MATTLKRGGSRDHTEPDEQLREVVASILSDVRINGERAVRGQSARLDDWNPSSFILTRDQIDRLCDEVPTELREQIAYAADGITRFADAQRKTLLDLDIELRDGIFAGHRRVPVNHVGAYVPGGGYQLITTALMAILPAKSAGVPEVTAILAPARGSGPSAAAVYAADLAGADRIVALGGVQALAALAYGAIPEIGQVDMLVGPGNPYVAEAKRQLFGTVGIDLLAGPSEILVLADDHADPYEVAFDLLSQAEHGPTSSTALVTDSEALAKAVLEWIPRVLSELPTAEFAEQSWQQRGLVVLAESREEMAEISDAYASEHVLLQVQDPDWFHERLKNYGGIFLGRWSSVVFGDKAAGPNSTLPTQRAARYTGGLSVEKFLKALTYQRVDPKRAGPLIDATAQIARAEGMEGHALTAELRRQGIAQPESVEATP